MNTPLSPRGSVALLLLIVGGVLMLAALIFSVALYIWSKSGPTYGENWNDLIAAGIIVYIGLPGFVIGLIIFIIGLVLRIRR